MQFYTSIFKNSKTTGVTHYPEEGPGPAGTVMTITFQLDGQEFIALNGGPVYQLSPAISLFVNCETQEEIDELWEKLSGGGETVECGWLKDKCPKVSGMVATTYPLVDHLIALFKRAASNPTFRSGRTM